MLKHREFQLDSQAATFVIKHCRRSPNREVCGLILTDNSIVEMTNESESDGDFAMNPLEFYAHRDRAAVVYHSHVGDCGGELTAKDIASAKEVGLPVLVYNTVLLSWDFFDPQALHPFPMECSSYSPRSDEYYLSWRFVLGRSDCAHLVRAWYAGRMNIDIRDYPRRPIAQAIGRNINQFDLHRIEENNFDLLLPDESIQTGDILVLALSDGMSLGHHVAVVNSAESNTMLHNFGEGRYSEIETYNDYWRNLTTGILRHRSLVPNNSARQQTAVPGIVGGLS